MRRCLVCECRKVIGSLPFLSGVLLCALLSLTAPLYTDADRTTYSVIECIARFDLRSMRDVAEFDLNYVLETNQTSWLALFIPIAAGLPVVYSITNEKASGNLRFIISRAGMNRYYLCKGIVGFLSGGLSLGLGYLLYGLIGLMFFTTPALDWATLAKRMTESFLYGGVWTMPAFLFLTVSENKYVILCASFMMKYVLTGLNGKILSQGIETENEQLIFLSDLFSPEAVNYLFSHENIWLLLIVHMGTGILLFVIYLMCAKRRWDVGL